MKWIKYVNRAPERFTFWCPTRSLNALCDLQCECLREWRMSPGQCLRSASRKSRDSCSRMLLAVGCVLSRSWQCCELHCREELLYWLLLLRLLLALAYLYMTPLGSAEHISMSWYWMGTWPRISGGNPSLLYVILPLLFYRLLFWSHLSRLLVYQDNPSRSFCKQEQRGRRTRTSISSYESSTRWSRAYSW